MQSVRFGRTGLEVSVAALGCGGHSRLGMRTGHDEAHATRIVEHAIDRGINLIDTSSTYGTETAVGRAIRDKRDRVFISTKSSTRRGDRLLSASELAESIELSLRRLDTDYVDILHLHSLQLDQYPHCLDVLLPELWRQQEAGKIRFLGVTEIFDRDSSHRMFREVLPDDHFDVIMVGFNLLNPSARKAVFPQTLQRDIATMIMFAVRRALSHPDVLAELLESMVEAGLVGADEVSRVDPLGFVRDFAGVSSVTEVAYRFCRHQPGVDVVLTGTGNAAHLDENIDAILAPPLPEELTARLDHIFGDVDSVSGN